MPTLVVLGADDPLVPVQASLAAYEHTADRTGRKQAVQVYPGAGHRLLRASGELAGGYLEALADWCLERHRDR